MLPTEDGEQANSMAAAVARRSYGKLVAVLCSRTRHVAAAEDALSEAFATALAEWPGSGCPANPEGWLLTEARRHARRRAGEYVPLADQDPGLWDADMIHEAEALLLRASALRSIGRFQLEAALQSAHAHRRRSGRADWSVVVQLYDALLDISASPVVAINRALAVSERDGVHAGLAALEAVANDARVIQYQPYWAARADLLSRSGAWAEAAHAYDIAIGLERDPAVRRFLQRRRGALQG